jgi:repressor LexA
MTIGDRIKKTRENLKISQTELANLSNTTKQNIYKYENGIITNIPSDKIETIAKILHVSPAYLMGWNDIKEETIPYSPQEMIPIPVIGRVAAGYNCLAETNIECYELVNSELINDGYDYVYLKVKGDSMTPLILEDDLVLVRIQSDVDNGDYAVVIVDEEDGLVKKIERGDDYITLLSENPYYPPRKFERYDMNRVRIYGKVIESKRKF